MASADAIGLEQKLYGVVKLNAVQCDGEAFFEGDDDNCSRLMAMSSRQKAVPMMGSTILMDVLRCSRSLASWVAPRMLESVE